MTFPTPKEWVDSTWIWETEDDDSPTSGPLGRGLLIHDQKAIRREIVEKALPEALQRGSDDFRICEGNCSLWGNGSHIANHITYHLARILGVEVE